MSNTITSEKVFIERAQDGFKLEKLRQPNRVLYYMTNYKDSEITVSKAVIKKLELKGVIDSNWDIHL